MDISDFQKKSFLVLENFKKELTTLRSSRPTSKMVEDIKAEYCGQFLILKQLAAISIVLPREIHLNVWDKNAIPAIVKSLEGAKMGFNVNVESNLIRLNLPSLSEERRQEIIKVVKRTNEDFRIQLRHWRDEANKKINSDESDGNISEDQKFALKEEIQKVVDKTNSEMELLVENKIKELNS